jgi:hypothetical protein
MFYSTTTKPFTPASCTFLNKPYFLFSFSSFLARATTYRAILSSNDYSNQKEDDGGQRGVNSTAKMQLCQRMQLRDGRWIRDVNLTVPYAPGTVTKSAYCNTRDMVLILTHTNGTKEGAVDSTCEFQKGFSTALFCDLMQNAVILFIGDSLTFEQYGSLVALMGGKVSEALKWRCIYKAKEGLDLSIVQNVCGEKNTTLVYYFSAYLDDIDKVLNETFPTALVMNRGTWIQNGVHDLKGADQALHHVHKCQQDCLEQSLPCPLFYRTSPPGHVNCATLLSHRTISPSWRNTLHKILRINGKHFGMKMSSFCRS